MVEYPCPACPDRRLTRHSSALRWVYTITERFQIVVFRLRCRPCRLTGTLLPEGLIPYHRYAADIVEATTTAVVTTPSSCRSVAVAVAGITLPDDQSPTDALLSVSLTPSYQRVHAWTRRLNDLAPGYAKGLLAWTMRLAPDANMMHHLGVPQSQIPKPALRAAFLLIQLTFTLTKANQWIPTLNRFVLRVVHAIPWRAPPSPHLT